MSSTDVQTHHNEQIYAIPVLSIQLFIILAVKAFKEDILMRILYCIVLLVNLIHCDKIKEWGKKRSLANSKPKSVSKKDIEKWKEKLNLSQGEIKELDQAIRKLIRKTNEAGSLSWKIARAYMRSGNYEMGTKLYTQALKENANKQDLPESNIHTFESAIVYWEKTLLYKSLNENLLFETGLAYANAARDRGWEQKRTQIAIDIFKSLRVKDPEDMRYPYELALIYFDASRSSRPLEDINANPYRYTEDAMVLIDNIIRKKPGSLPAHFARANFLYRLSKIDEAESEYQTIKGLIEKFKKKGIIQEDLQDFQSYQNVLNNLKQIQDRKQGLP
ncbi:MAG: hypothetical protein AAF518_24990 [Spirochaetota bacterium]